MSGERPGAILNAVPADVAAARQLADLAYMHYVERIGRKPAPMLDDDSRRQREGTPWVLEEMGGIAGILVLIQQDDHLLVDDIAAVPPRQGRGFGGRLLEFAAAEAARHGFRELRR